MCVNVRESKVGPEEKKRYYDMVEWYEWSKMVPRMAGEEKEG